MFVGVDVIGINSESEGLVIKHAIDASILALFPNSSKTITIDVHVVEDDEIKGALALVDELDDDEYVILLSKEALQDDVTLYKTICHECVHIKQYFNKELQHINYKRSIFNNKEYDSSIIPYLDLPWEIEAYTMEEEIYKCFENNHR